MYHPDFQLFNKSQHPRSVVIGDVTKPGYYEGIRDRDYGQQLIDPLSSMKARQAGVRQDERTVENDNLFEVPVRRSIYDGLNRFQI